MALDPRLILSGVQKGIENARPFSNLMAGAEQAQQFMGEQQRQSLLGQQGEQRAALAPLQQQAAEQKLQAGQMALDTATAQAEQDAFSATMQQLGSAVKTLKPFIEKGDLIGAAAQIDTLQGLGVAPEALADIDQLISTGDLDDINRQMATVEAINSGAMTKAQVQSSQFIPGVGFAVLDKNGKSSIVPVEGTGETREQKRIKDLEAKLKLAEGKAEIDIDAAGGKETKKLEAQLKLKPQLEADIATARQEAAKRGETLSELNQAKAALPGLKNVVSSLRQLAPIATSTLTGRGFDLLSKELGFGATKGSTARARFISIVDNEVLPLLKQTFGSAFTVQEGENLKATMGDPNASPDEKMAQLDSFIESKYRQIETKERELTGVGIGDTSPSATNDFDLEYDPSTGTFK
jgi:hypothetical protein